MDEIAKLAAAGAPEGTAVVAEEQTAGRGRAGRSWQAPPGTAILLSVLLRPPLPAARLGPLPLVVGAAVAEALETVAGVEPRLKWPNDVWLAERKVAGVLVTAREGANPSVVLGIGLNVNTPELALPAGATSLLVATGRAQDRDCLLDELLARLDGAYRRFLVSGSFDLEGWRRRAVLVGETVTVEDGGRQRTGDLLGVDETGALLLREVDGAVARVVAGELSWGPRSVASRIR